MVIIITIIIIVIVTITIITIIIVIITTIIITVTIITIIILALYCAVDRHSPVFQPFAMCSVCFDSPENGQFE